MKKILVLLALVGILGSAEVAWATRYACTPGYWKNHLDAWDYTTRDAPHTCNGTIHGGQQGQFWSDCDYTDVFGITGDTDLTDPPNSDTLLDALQPGGAGGPPAPTQPQQMSLAEHAVACILNATTTQFNQFSKSKAECISIVQTAYGAGTLAAFVAAKNQLEGANTGVGIVGFVGCPLNKDGINTDPNF